MASDENLEAVVDIDADQFTDTERDMILQVVARDEDIRLQEKSRIENLKEQLHDLQEKGVPEEEIETCGRVCRRCRTPLGILFNSGALCPACERTVCKTCRVPVEKDEEHSWLCKVCGKIREIRAESGAWFYTEPTIEGVRFKKKKVYGSFLIKKVFSKSKKNDKIIFKDPDWSDILEKEDQKEDKTYLVVTPAVSNGSYKVKEGNDTSLNNSPAISTTAPATTVETSAADDSKFVVEDNSHTRSVSEAIGEDDGEGQEHDDEGQEYDGEQIIGDKFQLNDDDRNTLLSIAHRTVPIPRPSSSEIEEMSQNEKLEQQVDNKDEVEDNMKVESDQMVPSSTSIYYNPEDDNSSSSSDENVNTIGNMRTIPELSGEQTTLLTEANNDVPTNEHLNIDPFSDNEVIPNNDMPSIVQEDSTALSEKAKIDEKEDVQDEKVTDGNQTDSSSGDEDDDSELVKTFGMVDADVNKFQFQVLDEEEITSLPRIKENLTRTSDINNDEEIFIHGMDFSSMQKRADATPKPTTHVVYNDLDLKDLRKTFLRRGKLKHLKLKSDEHVSSDSSSSSEFSSDNDDVINIPQVVSTRKNSSEEEIERFKATSIGYVQAESVVLSLDEENVPMVNSHDRKTTIKNNRVEDDDHADVGMNFSAMRKLSDLEQSNNIEQENDEEDLNLFIKAFSKTKFREKRSKMRSEEHSDRESSLSDASDDVDFDMLLDCGEFLEKFNKKHHQIVLHSLEEEEIVKQSHILKPKKIETNNEALVEEQSTRWGKPMTSIQNKPASNLVIHNDLDLKSLHDTFVRRRKVKLTKLKMFECSSSSDDDAESEHSNDSDDDNIEMDNFIVQVVPERRSSSDVEFEDFEVAMVNHRKTTIQIEEMKEEIFSKKTERKTDLCEYNQARSSDKPFSTFDFSKMQKISDFKPAIMVYENHSDFNDKELLEFGRQNLITSKNERTICTIRTEEHSDCSDAECLEEEALNTKTRDAVYDEVQDEDDLVAMLSTQQQSRSDDGVGGGFGGDIEEPALKDLGGMNNVMFGEHDDIGDADSIGSNYSDDDGELHNVQVAGEIYLGLQYNHKEKMFEVQVHKAKGLLIGDRVENSSNSYVKVYLLPNTKRTGKRKTKIVKKNLDPEYDEILSFKLEYDQLLSRTCGVSVWHSHFTQKNKRLGDVLINIQQYLDSGFKLEDPSPQWYTLTGRVVEREQVEYCGELFSNISYRPPGSSHDPNKKYNPTKGELCVHVIRAENLHAIHEGGFSNPFCKVQLMHNSKTEKFKTHQIKGTIEPFWDKQFTFQNIALNDLRNAILQFSVWDAEKGSSHALLGGSRLGTGSGDGAKHDSFGVEVELWNRVLDSPNDMVECTIPLRSTLDSVKEKALVPPVPVRIVSVEDHAEQRKKVGSIGNLSAKKFLQPDTVSLASTGSMLSLYSNAGGDGNFIITGEILFSVKYDDISGIFSVNIEKAKGLAAVDTKKMTSDPYVKVYLLPDKLKTSKKKTLHRRKTTNPIWNETIKYKFSKEELLSKTLQLSIWNHDRFGKNDCLGEVQLNMKQYAKTNKLEADIPAWYTLQELAPLVGSGAENNKGELLLGLKFDQGVLTVHVKEAHGLPSLDDKNLPNPFVKCYFLPDKSRKSKRKTGVQKKTISPTWNEKLVYKHVTVEDLQTRVVEITVWDYNSSSHQFLGGVRIGLPNGDENFHDCRDSEVSIWESMINHLGIMAEYRIPLRESMTSLKGQMEQDIPMITSTIKEEEMTRSYAKLASVVDENLEGTPTIRLSLQHTTQEQLHSADDKKKKRKTNKGELRVNVKESKNLPLKPNGDYPSTFCKIILHPKKKSEKFQTETYYKSVDPVWDTSVTFEDVTLEELRTRTLEVILLDEFKEKKGHEFARVRCGSGGFIDKYDDSQGAEIDLWSLMLNYPDRWNTKLIALRIEEYPDEPIEKPKKDKKPPKKSIENEPADNSESEEEQQEVESAAGSESPRTSALRAMGGDAAANVIDIMMNQNEPAYYHSSDGLHTITEENELESSGSVSTQPHMAAMPPSITITQTDVKPGDPPFDREFDDDPEFDFNIPEKKKPHSHMNFLKRSESMTSVYSTDSTANVYGQVPIRGEIQFGMKYDHGSGMFEVHIFQAKDLAAVDTKREISDPYCKLYLLPDKTKSGKRKTRTLKKNLNPEWEEILEFKITFRDLRTRTLNVSLWHQERLGRNVFLGEVMLHLDEFVDRPQELEVPKPTWYELCEKSAPPKTDLFKGEIHISLMFEDESLNSIKGKLAMNADDKKKKKKKKKDKTTTTGRINLHIKKCVNLPSADKDGLSDPFCKCYLLPKQSKNKRKTPVIKDTLEPEWDYKTEYDIDYEDLVDHGIEFTIWDWDKGKSNDLLGCARISLGNKTADWDDAVGDEIMVWQHLIDQPNKWQDFVIPLRSTADSRFKKR